MKKILFLFLVFSLNFISNAQDFDEANIQVFGDFIYIDQDCVTAASNEFETVSIVEKVILKKDLITSIVVQLDPPKRRNEEGYWKKVIVTTSERISRYESGVDAKAMSISYKSYQFLFKESSSANFFALELTKLCATDKMLD